MSPLATLLLALLGIVMIVIGVTIAKQMVERPKRSSSAEGDTGKEQGGFGKDLGDG